MKRLPALIFLAALTLAGAAWAAAWQPIPQRLDFAVKDPEALLERTYQTLKEWSEESGPEPFDVARARESKHHILSIHMEEYGADAVLVLIEDRTIGELNAYDFMLYQAPELEPVAWGSVLILEPFDEWLKGILRDNFDPDALDGI